MRWNLNVFDTHTCLQERKTRVTSILEINYKKISYVSINEFIRCLSESRILNLRKKFDEYLSWFIFQLATENKIVFRTIKKFVFFFNGSISNWKKFLEKICYPNWKASDEFFKCIYTYKLWIKKFLLETV